MRMNSAQRQMMANINKYGEGYLIVPNNVIGSTEKWVLYWNGKRLGKFITKEDARAEEKHHAAEQKRLTAQSA